MEHSYLFLDRETVDPLWKLSWKEFLRKWGKSRWATAKHFQDGNSSLRGLIAFGLDPEPSHQDVEQILERRTIRWTIQHSSPQYFVMQEILHHVPDLRGSMVSVSPSHDDSGALIAVGVRAYLQGEIGAQMLWAILKLHSVDDAGEWLRLSKKEKRDLSAVVQPHESHDLGRPIYRWQGSNACEEEEWTNCLNTAATRRFASFVMRAWRENWPAPRLEDTELSSCKVPPGKIPRFRDFAIARELNRPLLKKVLSFKRPCVFRRWE